MPRGLAALISAQFFSALADNALLIVAIALLAAQGHPAWWAPLLKLGFTVAYVVLAPFVGPLADAFVKARLMMAMNALKVLGVLALLAGVQPLAAFALVGVGAAAYAPAKYGLLTELVPPRQLVAANGWIEVTTVCAAIFGTVLGGLLVGPLAAGWATGGGVLDLAMVMLLGVYALAALLNLAIPDSGARYRRPEVAPRALWRGFVRAQIRLWRDAEGGLSMTVTTLFWGVAAVLQFAVLRWAQDRLALTLDRAAYLQAVVALGIVAGAAVAGRHVALAQASRLLPLGIALGVAVPLVALVGHWLAALPLLLLIGALGGALVVPLNALLQHRGHRLLTAGRSIAVQNFNENASVLVMLAVYAGLLALDMDIRAVLALFGALVATMMTLLWQRDRLRLRASVLR
ncbi:MAG: lysophospholipid transporter LplT [Rubrivivax sp.]|nr:lysophospholipid transporter LplT [Rubrivivax sp.]